MMEKLKTQRSSMILTLTMLISVILCLFLAPAFGANTALMLTENPLRATANLRIINADNGLVYPKINFGSDEYLVQEVDVVVTPDGTKALVMTDDRARASGKLWIIDIAARAVRHEIDFDDDEHPEKGVDLVVSPDGTKVIVATYDNVNSSGNLRLIDIATGTLQWKVDFDPNEHPLEDVDPLFTQDGQRIIFMTYDNEGDSGNLRIINVATGTVLHKINFDPNEHPVKGVDPVLTPDGTRVIAATGDNHLSSGNIRIIDVYAGSVLRKIDFDPDEHPQRDVDLLVTPDSSKIIFETYDNVNRSGNLRIINVGTGAVTKIDFMPFEHPISDLDIVLTPDGLRVLVPTYYDYGPSGKLRIINVATGTVLHMINFDPGEHPINGVDVVLTPDGTRALMPTFVDAGQSGNLRIIDVANGTILHTINFDPGQHPINGVDVALTPDGTRALMITFDNANWNGNLRIINVADGTVLRWHNFDRYEHPIDDVDVAFTPDGTRALIPLFDEEGQSGNLRIHNMVDGTEWKYNFDTGEHPIPGVDVMAIGSGGANSYDFLDEDFQVDPLYGFSLYEDKDRCTRCHRPPPPPPPPDEVRKTPTPRGVAWINNRTGAVVKQIQGVQGLRRHGEPENIGGKLEKIILGDDWIDKIVIIDDDTRDVVNQINLGGKKIFDPTKTKNGMEKFIVQPPPPHDPKIVVFDDQTQTIVQEVPLPGGRPKWKPIETPNGKEKIFSGTKVYFIDDQTGLITDLELGLEPRKSPSRSKDGNEKIIVESADRRSTKIVVFNDISETVVTSIGLPGSPNPLWRPLPTKTKKEKIVVKTPNIGYQVIYIDDDTYDVHVVDLPGRPKWWPRQTTGLKERIICEGVPSDKIVILDDGTTSIVSTVDLGGKVTQPPTPLDAKGHKGVEKIKIKDESGREWVIYFDYTKGTIVAKLPAGMHAGVNYEYDVCLNNYEFWPTLDEVTRKWGYMILNDAKRLPEGTITLPTMPMYPESSGDLDDIHGIWFYDGTLGLLDTVNFTLNIVEGFSGGPFLSSFTEEGTLVDVQFDYPISMFFDQVDSAGTSYINTSTEAPYPVSGFVPMSPFYEIDTSAEFTGNIEITIPYDPSITNPLNLYHWNGLEWEDVTLYMDPENGTIVGELSTLGSFVVGVPGNVAVTSPNGGETIPACTPVPITWTASPAAVKFEVGYSLANGAPGTWNLIASGITGHSYNWTPPAQGNQTNVRVAVRGRDSGNAVVGTDISDGSFRVLPVRVTYPSDPGIVWTSGQQRIITWQTYCNPAFVDIGRSTNGGGSWVVFHRVNGNPGAYTLAVPQVGNILPNCRIGVRLLDQYLNDIGHDAGDNNFTVQPH
jgi:hypothetical protein